MCCPLLCQAMGALLAIVTVRSAVPGAVGHVVQGANTTRRAKSSTATIGRPATTPPGHLQPFGGWRVGLPVEERTDVPRPHEFYTRYCMVDGGAGRPLVLRGAARRMAAMRWSDKYLLRVHGRALMSGVELGLKETRIGGYLPGFARLGAFLRVYNHSDIHLVSRIPSRMQRDMEHLSFLRCGGFLDFLLVPKVWLDRGNSRSVVHRDDTENVHCLLAGRKQFALIHPRWRATLEAHPNSANPPDRFGFLDARLDPGRVPGYGAYFGLDVDAVDLIRFPGWRDVEWSRAGVEAGDCIYIPHGWYHQVRSGPTRTLSVNVWYWRPERFHASGCGTPGRRIRFSDCSWGYVAPPGGKPHGVRRSYGVRQRITQCTPRHRHRSLWAIRKEL